MKRLGLRLTAALPLFVLAGCSSEDISDGINDAVTGFFEAMLKVIAIAMGLLLAFSVVLVIGIALIALGLRRKKVDAAALAFFVVGGGVILSAWPLIFSQSGLAGVWAPGSTGGVSAEPVVGQAIAVVAGIVIAVLAVKRFRKREGVEGATSVAAAPPPVPPAPPKPPAAPSSPRDPAPRPKRPQRPKRPMRQNPTPKKPPAKRAKAGAKSR